MLAFVQDDFTPRSRDILILWYSGMWLLVGYYFSLKKCLQLKITYHFHIYRQSLESFRQQRELHRRYGILLFQVDLIFPFVSPWRSWWRQIIPLLPSQKTSPRTSDLQWDRVWLKRFLCRIMCFNRAVGYERSGSRRHSLAENAFSAVVL